MSTREDTIRIIGVHRHRPDPAAWQFHLLGIDSTPFIAGVGRLVNTSVGLERTRNDYLVRILRIDQDARVVAEREVSAAASPRYAAVTARVKGL